MALFRRSKIALPLLAAGHIEFQFDNEYAFLSKDYGDRFGCRVGIGPGGLFVEDADGTAKSYALAVGSGGFFYRHGGEIRIECPFRWLYPAAKATFDGTPYTGAPTVGRAVYIVRPSHEGEFSDWMTVLGRRSSGLREYVHHD